MSYDLYFTSPSISLEEFENYFSKNPLYEVNNGQAFYQNEATGVYFFFNHEGESKEDYDYNVEVSFNLNYLRPHFFSLEAANEIQRFVSYFNCEIEDPQIDGMDNNLFSIEGFLEGWNRGNKFAVKSPLSQTDKTNLISTDKLDMAWNWNFSIQKKNETLGQGIFIPKIIFLKVDGVLGTCAVWPDAIPTFVPNVDFLHIPREACAPRKTGRDSCLLQNRDFPDFFSDYLDKNSDFKAFKLPNPKTPKFIKKYISSLKPFSGEIKGIAVDSVINKELMEDI